MRCWQMKAQAAFGLLLLASVLAVCAADTHGTHDDAHGGSDVAREAANDAKSRGQQQHEQQSIPQEASHVSSRNVGSAKTQDFARESERLYSSSLKILATLKARHDDYSKSSNRPAYLDGHDSSSRLLVPQSKTPFLDYLETALKGRGKVAPKVLSHYRKLVTGSTTSSPSDIKSSPTQGEDLMTKLLKAKYLRSSAKPSMGQDPRRAAVTLALERLGRAFQLGKQEAGLVLADLHIWGRYGLPQNTSLAAMYYDEVAQNSGDPFAQYMLGFLQSSNFGFAVDSETREGEGDQGAAVLHYTFAALGGQHEAELTMGYRHWVGIGVQQNCQDALPWYKGAAERAVQSFEAGPPGGKHLPPAKIRLADVNGGVYGPGASTTTAHSGHNANNANAVQPKTERDWDDLLEYYQFHADRGDAAFMFRIGRIYYQGFNPIGPNGGFGGSETGGRDFARALRWFMRIARAVWPRDPISAYTNPAQLEQANARTGQSGPSRQMSYQAFYDETKDVKLKVEDSKTMAAGLAAGYLGKMYLRGEGVPEQDFQKAFLWFQRGMAQGDRESHNGLGIMYREGLGLPKDLVKAFHHFQTAAAADHTDAILNLGKAHFARGEDHLAIPQFEHAIRHGEAFQSYYYLAEINNMPAGRPELCPLITAYYKMVAERGDWDNSDAWKEAERAWAAGNIKRALLGYWIMAEQGYEVAQNNVAWILDQDKRRLALPHYDYTLDKSTDRLALAFWTRSAAQDNGDALVKMGDYYMKGMGVSSSVPQAEKAAACYAGAANTHYSSIAMYNLGWMHENGIGVSQDFHLAKRYYDLALESNTEAYLPVALSLAKLHLRSLYKAIKSGDIKSISLFLSNEAELEDETSQSQDQQPKPKKWLWSWRRLRDEFFRRWIGEEMARQNAQRPAPVVNGERPAAPAPGQTPQGQYDRQAHVEMLEAQDDPAEWARRRHDEMIAQDAEEEYGLDDLEIPDFFGDTIGGRGRNDDDSDLLETLAILGLCLILGWLVYVRQARYDGQRQNGDRRQQLAERANEAAPVEELQDGVLAPAVAAAATTPEEGVDTAEAGGNGVDELPHNNQ